MIEYTEIMQKSYLDYAMSVITSRAVPDVRDGLKPVQRRVLYAMYELGLSSDKPHRKSARIVGDAMGKYHPHGDASIYETLVVMEQDFKKEMPLVDGHGNFGSVEGDGAAAMRYTEARLSKYAADVYLRDLDVVDYVPNFDETEKEPVVLPARVPNVLVNGSEGIAVGMTTSIPTHNLAEIIDGEIALLRNPKISTEGLLNIIKGPDFPTGGVVINKKDLKDIYETGAGKIRIRGRIVAEKNGKSERLVVTEIPYTMIGAGIEKFIQAVGELVESKKTSDIISVVNETGVTPRIVINVRPGTSASVKKLLFAKTRLEDTFSVNMLVIKDGAPEIMGIKKILECAVDFQYEISTKRYTRLLAKSKAEAEIKEGLIKACGMIDLIVEIIRGSRSISQAKKCLTEGVTEGIVLKAASQKKAAKLAFSETQAQAILALKLSQLIGLELEKLDKEYAKLLTDIEKYEKILSDKAVMKRTIIKDLESIKKEYGKPRKTKVTDEKDAVFEEKKEVTDVFFNMDRFGYCKLTTQGLRCRSDGVIFVFTNRNVHKLQVAKIPFKKAKEKGVPIDNLCNYSSDSENIIGVFSHEDIKNKKFLFVTKKGLVKVVSGTEFDVSRNTVSASKLNDGDEIFGVLPINKKDKTITLKSKNRKIVFGLDEIPEQKRNAAGVIGVSLKANDEITDAYMGNEEKTNKRGAKGRTYVPDECATA